jgi:hypothetical protein
MEAKEVFYLIIKYGLLSIIMLLLKSSKERDKNKRERLEMAKIKKEWTQNLEVTAEELEGLKAIKAAQDKRRAERKADLDQQYAELKEIYKAQQKRRGLL